MFWQRSRDLTTNSKRNVTDWTPESKTTFNVFLHDQPKYLFVFKVDADDDRIVCGDGDGDCLVVIACLCFYNFSFISERYLTSVRKLNETIKNTENEKL